MEKRRDSSPSPYMATVRENREEEGKAALSVVENMDRCFVFYRSTGKKLIMCYRNRDKTLTLVRLRHQNDTRTTIGQ